MNRAERIYRLHALLQERPHSLLELQEALGKSRATVVRDLAYMRDFMGAPIEYDRNSNGHRYRQTEPRFELPGLWLNESELHALLAMERLLEQMQPELLAPYIGPLRSRIRNLLAQSGQSPVTLGERILLQPVAARPSHPERFGIVAGSVLENHRLAIRYHGRERDAPTRRILHPQCLLRYRDNWYLVAHCEQADGLRTFSLDRVRHAEALPEPAKRTEPTELDRFLGASFGIFSGSAAAWAVLRFTPIASRWVADEIWHPDQLAHWHGTHYELQVPYSDPREIMMEILKYGPEVEVIAPAELRALVVARVRLTARIYGFETKIPDS